MEHFATTAIELLLETILAKQEEKASVENPTTGSETSLDVDNRIASRPRGDLG
jgi:hypothetical protein